MAATERGARLLALLATRFAAIAGVLAATDLRDASSLAAHGAATADAVNAVSYTHLTLPTNREV